MQQNEAVALATHLAQTLEKKEPSAAGGDDAQKPRGVISKEKGDRLRKKIRTVARMARMFKTLRQEHETVIRLKGVCPGHKLKPGLLLSGRDALTDELEIYQYAQSVDVQNDRRPSVSSSSSSNPLNPK